MKPRLLFVLIVLPVLASAQLAIIRQGRESAGALETGDFFGGAVACGDFNGDGFDDVATGSPFEKIGASTNQGGAVCVNYGSTFGVTWLGARVLLPTDGGYSNSSTAQMGYALAVGNFNNDAYDDLAVGLPAATVSGQASAGMVFVYLGGASGLSATAIPLTQTAFGGIIEANDRFGAALATGHLATDAYADLAIGSPGENGGAGAVYVIFGYASGVNTNQTLALDSADIGVTAQANAGLGSAVAIGNIRAGFYEELIVGAPNADVGIIQNTGTVHVVTGTSSGLNTGSVQHWDITATGDFYQTDSLFGFCFAVGDFYGDGDGTKDLAIGIPGMFDSAGRVLIARGNPAGNPTFPTVVEQYDSLGGGPGTIDEPNDFFGLSLAAGDFDGDGIDDLAVGAPGESDVNLGDDGQNMGWVQIFKGRATGFAHAATESHGEADLSDAPNGNASLGYALAFGRTSASPRKSLLAGAPAKNAGTGQVYDFAPWRQVLGLKCKTALAADCQNHVIYALKPFEHVLIASTTKTMTVLLGCEATARPANDPLHVSLNENYLIESWLADNFPPNSSCSIFGYAPFGDTHSFEQLLRGCVMVSGNDSAYAIADAMTNEANAWSGHTTTVPQFVALMNARAAQIGMNDTLFTNPPGVDNGSPYSTAFDMWLLAHEAMQNALFKNIVGTTEFYFNRTVPGTEAGIFYASYDKIEYGWLKGLLSRDARIVGIKPGGTPGAGTTGVVAAHTSFSADDLAYATGFGWEDGGTSKDQLAALVQLAIAQCDPYVPPGGFKGPGGPLGYSVWQSGNAQREGLQVMDFVFGTELPGEETVVLFQAQTPVPAGANSAPRNRIRTTPLWSVRSLQTTGIEVKLTSGYSGAFRNNGTAALSLTFTLSPPGTTVNVFLPAGQQYVLPPWTAPAGTTATVHLTVRNNSSTADALIGFEGAFFFEPNLAGTPPPVFRARLKPDTAPMREGIHVGEVDVATGSGAVSFPLLVAIEKAAQGFRYYPPIRIESFNVTRQPANDGVVILFSTIPGATSIYDRYDIQMTPTLSPPSWTRVGTVPGNYSGSHAIYQDVFIPAPSRFFRVVGNLAE